MFADAYDEHKSTHSSLYCVCICIVQFSSTLGTMCYGHNIPCEAVCELMYMHVYQAFAVGKGTALENLNFMLKYSSVRTAGEGKKGSQTHILQQL